MHAIVSQPSVPVGKIKSFGPFGPKYEVGPALHKDADGKWLVEITMVDTGEKSEYSLSRLVDDPEAE